MMKTPVPRPGGPVNCQSPHDDLIRAPYTIRLLVIDLELREVLTHTQHVCTVCCSQLLRWIAEDAKLRNLTGLAGPYDEGVGAIGHAFASGFGNDGTGVW